MPTLDVLIPTYRRPAALAVTLTSLTAQTLPTFRVVVSDQSDEGDPESSLASEEVQTAVRLLRARGREVELRRHLPRRGLAEHRQFLLDCARAPYALFLDDDVLCEPTLAARLLDVIEEQRCGFVGSAVVGLSHLDDVRPHEQWVEPWDGPVRPEVVEPGSHAWGRHALHNAANPWHAAQSWGASERRPLLYKVAWVGGCVLYDVAKLRAAGGFTFWRDLPEQHCGEDALAQLRVMARDGGCGILPSGAYHLQVPTTVVDRTVDAPQVLRAVG
ncbi:MAG: glycosyltransferase family A protein [Kineosporiaceae bacterium]